MTDQAKQAPAKKSDAKTTEAKQAPAKKGEDLSWQEAQADYKKRMKALDADGADKTARVTKAVAEVFKKVK